MKNFVQPGETLNVIAPYAVTAGQGVLVGTIFGVAVSDALISTNVPINTCGVYDLTALGTDTPAAGAAAYWDNTNRRLTTTAGGNTLVGSFLTAKANGVTIGRVWLKP